MSTYRKKLIEVSLPLEAINAASAREKLLRQTNPVTVHLWWARRPLVAARAVLFAQLVDDPSSWVELFPTEQSQAAERKRLFRVLEDLLIWENSKNEGVMNAARLEIARSHARSSSSPKAKSVLAESVTPSLVRDYLATEHPPLHDPFAGGGTIPLEAQRLGLRTIATDLNPVAVLINRALVQIPSQFVRTPPVNPDALGKGKLKYWENADGLADDVRYYGDWLRAEAQRRIGHLYPSLPGTSGNERTTAVAWLWARTVESPDPAFRGCHVPLISNFWLSTKPGKETWLEPVVSGRSYGFEIRRGKPQDREAIERGTKLGRGANFRCILSNSPIEPDYIKSEGMAGRIGTRLMAVVGEGKRERIYVAPDGESERLAATASPTWVPEGSVPERLTGGTCFGYGMKTWSDLFTRRQLVALETLLGLVEEVRERASLDAAKVGASPSRGDAIATYLGLVIGNWADLNNSLTRWKVDRECPVNLFARQAIPMVWDFPEANPFSSSGGSLMSALRNMCNRIAQFDWMGVPGVVNQADARQALADDGPILISMDPPYYDNISYADLSDFFYVLLRHGLRRAHPDLFGTMLVPKAEELVAAPYRHGGRAGAERFFLDGMSAVLRRVHDALAPSAPATIYYAFKQSETSAEGASSTGWETFLEAVLQAGLTVEATLPIRTELPSRMLGKDTNALASSVVLVCRRRPESAPTVTRGEFRRMLRKELPDALSKLQQGNIAPVDVAQASIGPGMAIFSRHKAVAEADGKPMTVRSALQLINEVLDEYLSSGEGDFDADTRFAITWYEQHGWEPGLYGDAETLAKARNVSVEGVVEAGICKSAGGKVRILKRSEMRPLDYDPATDARPTVWEFTQHMIRNLEDDGEEAAARLLKKLGSSADATRELAYRLYNTCERKKWAEDARSYNGLILAWTELEKLASRMGDEPPPAPASTKSVNGKKKPAKTATGTKGQQKLFEGDGK